MDHSRQLKRFALLVGVDLYLNNNARKDINGSVLSLSSLQGCVNDVEAIQKLLQAEFQVDNLSILTSSPAESQHATSVEPSESLDQLPTFKNIKSEFDKIIGQASAGDFFFFHFSGHGGRLQPLQCSPSNRSADPSLLTADFCQGEPAVRGWQLNRWLERLNNKEVRVVAILDSCHSGGAWRGGPFRTPADWPVVPNLPADEAAAPDDVAEPGNRDGELANSWSINPKGFTLMAACESEEKATEKTINGKPGGAFTHALVNRLKKNKMANKLSTYRVIRDQIALDIKGQTPVIYGQDRLLFFGNVEPFSATPLVAEIKTGTASLPIGKIHGVCLGSEFSSFPPSYGTGFSITQVHDFDCNASISDAAELALRAHQRLVVPSRWSFGEKTLRVSVDSTFENEFQRLLFKYLQNRIASDIEITEIEETAGPDDSVLTVSQNNGHIGVLGTGSWIGYRDQVRGLDIAGQHMEERASKAANALSHLARFEQVFNLKGLVSNESPPYEVKLSSNGVDYPGPFPNNQRHAFIFKNMCQDELYLTVISLGPGFNIKQFYPSSDFGDCVKGGQERSFPFDVSIPSELIRAGPVDQAGVHRDILRTIITKGKNVSWKSLELPHLWNADQVELGKFSSSPGRDVRVVSTSFSWWVQDLEIFTHS
ncbi:hypothetical protein Brms1b_013696 [Colletotrichum noveboracense]|nr:hypothetical protein Brms1b_013696 [Colletotrichum noveboracense]